MTHEICCNKSEGHLLVKQLGLHESTLGDLQGAKKQYRDSRGTNSIHAREFTTKFCLHRDKYNPEQYPIEHFFVDVLKPEAVVAGGLTFMVALAISKNWKSALCWSLGVGTFVQLLADNYKRIDDNEEFKGRRSLPYITNSPSPYQGKGDKGDRDTK